jgi:hypothetical protein
MTNEAAERLHDPDEGHRYRIECDICGQRGTINVSVEPQRAAPAAEPDALREGIDNEDAERLRRKATVERAVALFDPNGSYDGWDVQERLAILDAEAAGGIATDWSVKQGLPAEPAGAGLREAVSAAVWAWLEAQPGFNEEIAQAEADLAAGKGTPYAALSAERKATVEVLQIWRDYWLTQEGVAYGAQTGEALRLMLRQFSAILDAEDAR